MRIVCWSNIFFFTVTLENCCCVVTDFILSLFYERWKPVSVCMQNSHEQPKALMTDAQWRVSTTESLGRAVAWAVANTTSDSCPLILVGRSFPLLLCPLLLTWLASCAVFSPTGKKKNFPTLCAPSIFVPCCSSQDCLSLSFSTQIIKGNNLCSFHA